MQYFPIDPNLNTKKEQETFEKNLFQKTHRQNGKLLPSINTLSRTPLTNSVQHKSYCSTNTSCSTSPHRTWSSTSWAVSISNSTRITWRANRSWRCTWMDHVRVLMTSLWIGSNENELILLSALEAYTDALSTLLRYVFTNQRCGTWYDAHPCTTETQLTSVVLWRTWTMYC